MAMDSGKDQIIPPGARTEVTDTSRWSAVIDRIASQGLRSAAQLRAEGVQFFPSDDEFPRDYVAGISLWPFPPDNREAAEYFSRRLYADAESVIPVILERPGEKRTHYDSVKAVSDEVIKRECERRVAASFLVICRSDSKTLPSVSQIPSEEFDYVLFPRAVYERYIQDPSATPFPQSVQIVVINDMVKRFVSVRTDMELEVPNYEQSLIEILNSGVKSIFVHGVRLPLDNEKTLFKKDKSVDIR